MKISSLTLPDSAEDGVDLHLKHPARGHLLYTGEGADADGRLVKRGKAQPVTVRVRSIDSEAVQEARRADRRETLRDPEMGGSPNAIDAMIVSWAGLEDEDGKAWPCTRANKLAFMTRQPAFDRQVTAFSQDQSNFFGAAAKT